MKNLYKKLLVLILVFGSACDLDGDLVNPNEPSVEGADVNLLMNGIQLNFADFFNKASNTVDRLVRMQAMTAGFRYPTAILPQTEDLADAWQIGYQNVLINIKTMIPMAQEKNLTTHVAVGKILEAYTYMTLVDMFGDIPRTDALRGDELIFNPEPDGGEEVYDYVITVLNEAKTELAKTGTDAGGGLERDIYYDGDRAKWAALANTLELKAWLNLSMVSSRTSEANAKIDALLDADLVDTEDENFTYKYGTVSVPVSRHPLYNRYYGPNKGSATGYIGNYFLYELYNGKGVEDPRWRYYFYRQVGSIAQAYKVDPKSVGCSPGAIPDHYINGNYVFCTFDPGFYGRDHGDASGTPPDSPVITAAGVYPAGGKLDTNPVSNTSFAQTTVQGDGANGAGIEPIFMSFFTEYMKAEIMERRGQTSEAKTQLLSAIQSSINQVKSFAKSRQQELAPALEPSTTDYLDAVSTLYDGATNKLHVIGREMYVSAWGNGIEAYNVYRRTGGPDNIQPPLQLTPGPFMRALVYPASYANLNSSAVQRDPNVTNRVFWDTNPEELK